MHEIPIYGVTWPNIPRLVLLGNQVLLYHSVTTPMSLPLNLATFFIILLAFMNYKTKFSQLL